METYVLVAFIWLGWAQRPWFEERRTPDLPELQCKLMKMQIDRTRPGQSAWCEIQGRPGPVWSPAPPRASPVRECADCKTIKERGRAST